MIGIRLCVGEEGLNRGEGGRLCCSRLSGRQLCGGGGGGGGGGWGGGGGGGGVWVGVGEGAVVEVDVAAAVEF